MFLTLVLLGLGMSYYCLRRRPVQVIRRLPMSMGSGSEITKLSGSSLGNLSVFEGVKIPRVHAPLQALPSSSGSEGPLISDTLPSDYPSESHSEEDVDTRSLPVSSAGSFENRAYVQENSSIYSENYGHTQEFQAANAMAQQSMVPRLPLAVKESSPKFDVQVRIKRAPPPPPSPMTSDTESVATSRGGDRNNLSTIMESHEDRESVMTMDSMPQDVAHSHFTYVPELHPAPRHAQQPPVFSRILRKQQENRQEIRPEIRQTWPDDLVDGPDDRRHHPETRSLVSLGTEMTDTHSVGEMMETSHIYPHERIPETSFTHTRTPETYTHAPQNYHTTVHMENVDVLPEPPIAIMRKPELTSHVVDDVFMRTITEKTTIEDIEKYKRMITEYKAAGIPPDPKWEVIIRNFPTSEQRQPQWENFSDVSSASGMTLTPKMERQKMTIPPINYLSESGLKLTSPQLVGNMKPIEMPPEDKAVPNWDVLIRILESADLPDVEDTSSEHSSAVPLQSETVPLPLQRHLSYEDRTKWKQIITTESSLR